MRVEHLQQHGDDPRTGRNLALAQLRQQGLRLVRGAFQLAEIEKPAGALERVHGTENPVQQVASAGLFLPRDQVALHLVHVLAALREELQEDVVRDVVVHLNAEVGRGKTANSR